MIRALVFDFDGLILDTETPLIEAYGDVHEAHGIAFDRAVFVRCVGHAEYAFDAWSAFGPESDRAALREEMLAFYEARTLRQPILPGVVALMDAARTAGMKLALASNSKRDHCERHLRRLGLFDRFQFLACYGEVPSPKPEPDLYRHAVNQLGLRPVQAIAFEDSYTGSLAARRAGLWVVVAPNVSTAHHDLSHAHRRVASLAELDLAELCEAFASGHA